MKQIRFRFLPATDQELNTPLAVELGCDHILRTYFERDSESNEVDTDVEIRIAE